MFKLKNVDYIKILNYYGKPIPRNKKDVKKNATNILTQKLCSCIKKVGPKSTENRSIRICTNSVVSKKGLTRGKFKCKDRRMIQLKKKLNKTLKLK
jgi:hypothetical protein